MMTNNSKGKSTMSNVRKVTNKILDSIKEGSLSSEQVIIACMNYMSEASIADMASDNKWFDDENDEDSDDENDDDE
jgi:hypothetical protein